MYYVQIGTANFYFFRFILQALSLAKVSAIYFSSDAFETFCVFLSLLCLHPPNINEVYSIRYFLTLKPHSLAPTNHLWEHLMN